MAFKCKAKLVKLVRLVKRRCSSRPFLVHPFDIAQLGVLVLTGSLRRPPLPIPQL
jgi:hypothetical protein